MTTARDDDTNTAALPNAEATPAVGIPVHRHVGRLEPKRAALMRQITLAQREVRSWPAWMTARATMPNWMLEWDDAR